MSSLLLQKHLLSICLILFASFAAAQGTDKPPVCASPEDVLQHYSDAVGGKAVYDIQSRTITAKESNRGFGNEHYIYKIKWKAPNKVAAGSTPYLFNALPVSYPNGTFIFDGEDWSNFDRRRSRNEERDPQWQRALKHKNPCNEDPQFMELRVVADPLLMTRAHELYSSFEMDTDSNDDPGVCVVRATRIDQWRNERQDTLTFDAVSGLLRSWDIQTGLPSRKRSVQFQFNDYRQLGAIKFPYYVYFDFNDTVFRFTSVVHNKHLSDSEFQEKPALP